MTLAGFVKQHEWQTFKLTVTLPHPAGPRPWEVEFAVFSFAKVKRREEDGANLFTYFVGSKGEAAEKIEAGAWVPFAAGGMSATALKYDNGFREDGNLGLLAADKAGRKLVYLPRRGAAPPQALTVSLDALFKSPAKKSAKRTPVRQRPRAAPAR